MFYDSCLLIAIFIIATAIILPLNGGNAVTSHSPFYPLYLLYLSLLCYFYFTWQWYKGGQTLGMRAWNIHVVSADITKLNKRRLALRFFFSVISWLLLGAGFLYALLEKDNLTLHDRLSKTQLIIITLTA